MRIQKQLLNGMIVTIIVRAQTESRLTGTCFRGQFVRKAGNFRMFKKVHDIFENPRIEDEFLNGLVIDINGMKSEQKLNETFSDCIDVRRPVGWSSTIKRDQCTPDMLERRKLGRNGYAQFVRSECTDMLAPQTNLLTIIYEIKLERREWVVVVHSLYPGEDVGELEGDVTEREGVVFFDWNHPGA